MSGLEDLLAKLTDATKEAKPAPTSQSAMTLSQLSKQLNDSLEEANARQALKAKVEAKRAELREGGRRAAEKDWVTSVCPAPMVPDVVIPIEKRQAPIAPPKPVAERSVEELYVLLNERCLRLAKVVVQGGDDQTALANATAIANLLVERGEDSEKVATHIVSLIKGGETK